MNERIERQVSFGDEALILVDTDDREIGTLSKDACHDGDGLLHRAFSAFLFNDRDELLLQRRAPGKRLWPGYWSNSCCSHPRVGEELAAAALRRLDQELGVEAELTFIYKFRYHARFGESGSERELCSVFVGRCNGRPQVNATEISEWRYIGRDALDRELAASPDEFTPWFRLEWEALQTTYRRDVERALAGSG